MFRTPTPQSHPVPLIWTLRRNGRIIHGPRHHPSSCASRTSYRLLPCLVHLPSSACLVAFAPWPIAALPRLQRPSSSPPRPAFAAPAFCHLRFSQHRKRRPHRRPSTAGQSAAPLMASCTPGASVLDGFSEYSTWIRRRHCTGSPRFEPLWPFPPATQPAADQLPRGSQPRRRPVSLPLL